MLNFYGSFFYINQYSKILWLMNNSQTNVLDTSSHTHTENRNTKSTPTNDKERHSPRNWMPQHTSLLHAWQGSCEQTWHERWWLVRATLHSLLVATTSTTITVSSFQHVLSWNLMCWWAYASCPYSACKRAQSAACWSRWCRSVMYVSTGSEITPWTTRW